MSLIIIRRADWITHVVQLLPRDVKMERSVLLLPGAGF